MNVTDNYLSINLTSYKVEGIISDSGNVFKIKRRLTHRDKKQGKVVDTDETVVQIRVSLPDEYKCCYMQIDYSEQVMAKDWEEILNTVESMLLPDQMTFVRFSETYLANDKELEKAFEKFGFYKVSDEDNTYEHERKLYKWMSILICLGLPIGVLFGRMTELGIILGICYGFCFGMVLGAIVDYNNARKRQQLIEGRNLDINN